MYIISALMLPLADTCTNERPLIWVYQEVGWGAMIMTLLAQTAANKARLATYVASAGEMPAQ